MALSPQWGLLLSGAAGGIGFLPQFILLALLDFFFPPSPAKKFPEVSNCSSAVEVTADILGVVCGECTPFRFVSA